jgi:hypothetical protein
MLLVFAIAYTLTIAGASARGPAKAAQTSGSFPWNNSELLFSSFIRDFPFSFSPTTSMGLLRDSLPSPLGCKDFLPVRPGYSLAQRCFHGFSASQRPFSPGCEDTSSVVSGVFVQFHFLHPDIAVTNLSRPMASRVARNNFRGTATSAIWKTIFWEWRTTFAPILICFSRNVVNVQ